MKKIKNLYGFSKQVLGKCKTMNSSRVTKTDITCCNNLMLPKIIAKSIMVSIILTTLIIIGCNTQQPLSDIEDDKNNLANFNQNANLYVDFTYHDLDLTKEELKAIEKYQTEQLVVGSVFYDYFHEIITYDGVKYNIGMNIAVIQAIENIFDLNMIIKQDQLDGILQGIYDGDIDFSPGPGYESDRAMKMNYSKPVISGSTYLYTNGYDFATIDDLNKSLIGRIKGYSFITADLISQYNIEMIEYDTEQELIQALQDNEIQGIVSSMNKTLIKAGLTPIRINRFLHEKNGYFVYSKHNPDLVHIISAIEKAYEYDETLSSMVFFDEDYIKLNIQLGTYFTQQEKDFIESTHLNPVKFYTYPIDSIYSTIDKSGEYIGIIPDILCESSLFNGMEYEILLDSSILHPKKTIEIFEQKDSIDGFFPMYKVEGYSDNILYTSVIRSDEVIIVGNNEVPSIMSIADLEFANIGIVKGYPYIKYFDSVVPNKTFKEYETYEEVIDAYYAGQIDYFVFASDLIYRDYIFRNQIEGINVKFKTGFNTDIVISLSNDERGKMVKQIFDKTFLLMNKTDIMTKYESNLTTDRIIENRRKDTQNRFLIILIAVILVCAILMLIILVKNIRLKRAFKQDAFTDELTDCENRKAFFKRFETLPDGCFTFGFSDIDNFKNINDVFGHAMGDSILVMLSKRLKNIEHGCDVYRIGGDEFVIVTQQSKEFLKKELENVMKHPFKNNNVSIDVNVSTGVVSLDDYDFQSISDVLSLSDYSMYQAKKRGKNQVISTDDEIIQSHEIEIEIEKKLKYGIENIGLYPKFQPIMNIEQKMIGFEALARWQTDNRQYYPNQFIGVFENIDKIHVLDLFIFDSSLNFLSSLINKDIKNKRLFVSTNFSPKSLNRVKVEDFDKCLNKYDNITKENIYIEVTETSFLASGAHTLIEELKKNGYQIAMDDFSSGHSSLSTILKHNVDIVKIDKDIIDELQMILDRGEDVLISKQFIVFKTITHMLVMLNKKIIAEGVETYELYDLLRSLEGVNIQGYYFYSELSAEEMNNILVD